MLSNNICGLIGGLPTSYNRGIDAEEGGVGGHSPIANYIQVVNSILSDVSMAVQVF